LGGMLVARVEKLTIDSDVQASIYQGYVEALKVASIGAPRA
jgi:hypothetical protein